AIVLAVIIACLVGGNCKQPRLESPLCIERLRREMDLEKRLLENIIGRSAGTKEPGEKMQQFVAVTPHEPGERCAFTSHVSLQKGFVASLVHFGLHRLPNIGRT